MPLKDVLKTSGSYSSVKERSYYAKARRDTSPAPYHHLDAYLAGSVGVSFFRAKSVLDLGCGEGVYSAWIADRGGASKVLGVDLIEHRIRWEYERALPNLKFLEADILQHDFRGRQFDVVFMNLVLHHLRFALGDVARVIGGVLKPGGSFLAFEPNVYSPMTLLAHLIHDRSANEGFLTPHRIRTHLEEVGLRDVAVGYFWRNRAWAKNPLLGSCFWIRASKPFG